MLENLVEYYRKSDGSTKKKILGCIFSEKLVLEKGKDATHIFTEPIQSIINISRALGDSKKRKRSKMTSCLVWYPQQDSNLYLVFRKHLFYPLNYGGKVNAQI